MGAKPSPRSGLLVGNSGPPVSVEGLNEDAREEKSVQERESHDRDVKWIGR